MPLSRSPRMDRRRRVLREGYSTVRDEDEGYDKPATARPSRSSRSAQVDDDESEKRERGVAYSHSVRRTCQHRLVQFIPVRRISLTGAILASALLPIFLCVMHYLVFVNGYLPWYRHPMSALFDASSPHGLAAWLCSHLWLLCLASTVLTFRLRKHKLDDYEGEYRLWFWLVFTCIIGSIDSTTHVTELFGMALDRWAQAHVGWTGPAITQATLATLIGLLGLRLCGELKIVPASISLWLVGLTCWAISAVLGHSMLKIDMTIQTRVWLKASLWLSGLTCIWLCSLMYLRAVFMEAQQRFIQRSGLTFKPGTPWRERLSSAMPRIPFLNRRDEEELEAKVEKPAKVRRKKPAAAAIDDEEEQDERSAARPVKTAATAKRDSDDAPSDAPAKRGWGLPKFSLKRSAAAPNSISSDAFEEVEDREDRAPTPRSREAEEAAVQKEYAKRSMGSWFGRRKSDATDAADNESRKAAKEARSARRERERDNDEEGDAEASVAKPKRSLRDRFTWKRKPKSEQVDGEGRSSKKAARGEGDGEEAPKKRRLRLPKPSMPKLPKFSLPRPKLPKLKLPSFRLPPPEESASADGAASADNRSGSSNRPFPSTSSAQGAKPSTNPAANSSSNADPYRGLSKAERKRLRRMQREEGDDEEDTRAA